MGWFSESESERHTRMHNQGQEDAANSEWGHAVDYDSPSQGITEQGIKDNEAYEEGWKEGSSKK